VGRRGLPLHGLAACSQPPAMAAVAAAAVPGPLPEEEMLDQLFGELMETVAMEEEKAAAAAGAEVVEAPQPRLPPESLAEPAVEAKDVVEVEDMVEDVVEAAAAAPAVTVTAMRVSAATPAQKEIEPKAPADVDDVCRPEQRREAVTGDPQDVASESKDTEEVEQDAHDDDRTKIAASDVRLSEYDATLNVMPGVNGYLMALHCSGFQHLLASVRASAGVRAGRHMFEVRVVEYVNIVNPEGSQCRAPNPRQVVRVGVSLAGSSLFLTDTANNVCFDSEGYFVHEKKRVKVSQKFGRHDNVAVLINMDLTSSNANTLSLFCNGVRSSEPQPLPEGLRGKVLYPTITYKNVTLQVNFGPVAQNPLPFRCRLLKEAAAEDLELAGQGGAPEDSKHEVLFPVGLPDQGVFDWVDDFVASNPSYTELSDRKILDWALKSGLSRTRCARSSNDKPDINLGIPQLDSLSVQRALAMIAPALRRNYVVMELRSNLLADERRAALLRFGPEFRKVAMVLMGEPGKEYKDKVRAMMLAEKACEAGAAKKRKALDDERKRVQQARDGGNAGKSEAGVQGEGEIEREDGVTKQLEEQLLGELTAEEKNMWWRKCNVPDISPKELVSSYASFSLPLEEDGFDAVRYVWQPLDKCAKLLREYVLEKKLTQRVEDLKPSPWFSEQLAQWQKAFQVWKKRHSDFKDPAKRVEIMKEAASAAKHKRSDANEEDEERETNEAKGKIIDAEDIDVFSVEDVMDIGNGEPIFRFFVFEDWELLSARFGFHLMLHAFRKQLDDPDRPSFTETHLPFYYSVYFRKTFNLKHYGVDSFHGFIKLIDNAIDINSESSMLETLLSEDTSHEYFVKLTEDHRRERARLIEAGDETATLKFSRPAPPPRQVKAVPLGGEKAASVRTELEPVPRSRESRPSPVRSAPEFSDSRPLRTHHKASSESLTLQQRGVKSAQSHQTVAAVPSRTVTRPLSRDAVAQGMSEPRSQQSSQRDTARLTQTTRNVERPGRPARTAHDEAPHSHPSRYEAGSSASAYRSSSGQTVISRGAASTAAAAPPLTPGRRLYTPAASPQGGPPAGYAAYNPKRQRTDSIAGAGAGGGSAGGGGELGGYYRR